MTATPPQLPRYHSLDALRAIMMLLGLVLHTCVNYLPFIPDRANWPYQDAQASNFFGWLIVFIHSFRMPTFFVVAGFFAAFLCDARGIRAFLRHRLSRIGGPLVGGWLVLYPLLVAGMLYARGHTAASNPAPLDLSPSLFHLWFLYHLLIFCSAGALLSFLVRRIDVTLRERVLDLFQHIVHRRYGPVVFAALSCLPLYLMESWHYDDSSALVPPVRLLAVYGLFFTFGWLIYQRREVLPGFKPGAWKYVGAGLFFHAVFLFFYDQGFSAIPGKPLMTLPLYDFFRARGLADAAAVGTHVVVTVALALMTWFLVYGFLGLFLRYLERPSRYVRYLADASYWMYIVHILPVVVLPTLFADWQVASGVKFSLVLGMTVVITLLTYHYFVRGTCIGARLNGRRYPRVAPWREVPATP